MPTVIDILPPGANCETGEYRSLFTDIAEHVERIASDALAAKVAALKAGCDHGLETAVTGLEEVLSDYWDATESALILIGPLVDLIECRARVLEHLYMLRACQEAGH
jgi:hypothetical protein